jgi:hypothetical protein
LDQPTIPPICTFQRLRFSPHYVARNFLFKLIFHTSLTKPANRILKVIIFNSSGVISDLGQMCCRRDEKLVNGHSSLRKPLPMMIIQEAVQYRAIWLNSIGPEIRTH